MDRKFRRPGPIMVVQGDAFLQIVDQHRDVIFISQGGIVVYANKKLVVALGYERAEELVGLNTLDLAHPDEREFVRQRIASMESGETPPAQERRIRRRDGSWLLVESVSFPVEFQGKPAAALVGRDLTEKLRADAIHRRTEEEFRRMVDAMPVPVMVHDGSTILYGNDASLRSLGYDQSNSFVGRKVIEFVVPEDREGFGARIAPDTTSGGTATRVTRLLHRNGSVVIHESAPSVSIEFEGRPSRLAAAHDITARRDNEERLRALFEESPVPIVLFDADGTPLRWNHSAAKRFRWDSGGTGPSKITQENLALIRPVLERSRKDGTVEETRQVTSWWGEETRLRVSVAPVRDGRGTITSFVVIVADLTVEMLAERQREQAAMEWQSTFDSVEVPILLIDRTRGVISRMNNVAAAMCNLTEIGAIPLASLGDSEPWVTARRLLEKQEATGGVCDAQVSARGRVWLVYANSVKPPAEDRQILVLRDITTIVELQDSLRRSEAVAAMGSLVAGVAHEVRNPLFGMSASLDAFEARFGREVAQQPFIDAIRSELKHLNELMRDLLEYGTLPSLNLTPNAVSGVVEDAVRACQPVAAQHGVSIETALGSPGSLPMDPSRLERVFENLVLNAIQHSPRGGVVRIDGAVTNGQIEIRVVDGGSGFPPEDLTRVFKPFFSRRRGGTGLGLSIVQKIIEEHGGSVEAGNVHGGGGRVTVRLPIAATPGVAPVSA